MQISWLARRVASGADSVRSVRNVTSGPHKTDRVLIKGLGLHFEGEGRPALVVAFCGAGIIALGFLITGFAGPAGFVRLVARVFGHH